MKKVKKKVQTRARERQWKRERERVTGERTKLSKRRED